jgi:hypothetical protein
MNVTRAIVVLAMGLPGAAFASVDCTNLPTARASSAGPAPLAAELVAPSALIGATGGVLAHGYDESQSVEEVLLRLRIEGCRTTAFAPPAGPANPDDPAAYKPQTEFDNTPWRFDMNQNGRRMTADEFDAWMKARGVRVARGSAPAAAVPGADVPAVDGTTPAAPADGGAPTPAPAPAQDANGTGQPPAPPTAEPQDGGA